MTCHKCNDAHENIMAGMPMRVGNKAIGWGTVLIIGCDAHLTLVRDQLRAAMEADEHAEAE